MSICLFANCKKCGIGNGFATGELSNDEYSVLTCKNGHKVKYFFFKSTYPIYFDHGLDTYSEGNYFEAFVSIYHAWEQFLFTFVKTMILVSTNQSYESVEEFTKPISKNSTQIEGAFNAIYANHFGKKAPQLNSKQKNLRNSIIHGKRNPEKADVESCAIAVYDFIKFTEIRMFTGKTGSEFPTTLLDVYDDRRIFYLKDVGLLTDEDLESGDSYLVNDGSHILGRSPATSDAQFAMKVLTFDEFVKERQSIKKLQDLF